MNRTMKKRNIKWLSTVAILGAMSAVIMLVKIPLWFAPDFYTLDFSEIPVLIGAFALGPFAGIAIEAIKVLLNVVLNGSYTMGVGELANFLIGVSLVLPASIVYFKHKTKKSAIVGLALGVLFMILVGSILNAYLLLPFYAFAYHMNVSDLVAIGTLVNPNITSLTSFIMLAVAPFNLVKGTLVSIIVILIYKRVSFLIKGKDDEGLESYE
ncbi:MAG: ECF transporter S component [Candidatus Izemoplasmatales bacterium]|nr:ECF transporter S component [Candidatus Izemoplasmatales bacterium]